MNHNTLAAIDIGSNAIRLLINSIEQYNDERQFKKIAFIRVPLRLGGDVFTIGEIGTQKADRLFDARCRFGHTMKAFNVIDYRACATSAMREATNGQSVTDLLF